MTGYADWQACADEPQRQALLQRLVQADAVRPAGAQANILHEAVQAGDLEVLRRLSDAATRHPDAVLLDVNQADADGNTPLMLAAEAGRLDLVRTLLPVPHTQVDHARADGQTAVSLAARGRHIPVLNALTRHQGLARPLAGVAACPADMAWLGPYWDGLRRTRDDMRSGGVLCREMGEFVLYVGGARPVQAVRLSPQADGHTLERTLEVPPTYAVLSPRARALGEALVGQFSHVSPHQAALEAHLATDFCEAVHAAIPVAARAAHRAASDALYEDMKTSRAGFKARHRAVMPSDDPHNRAVMHDEHFATEVMESLMEGVFRRRSLLPPALQTRVDAVLKPMFMAVSASRISTRHTQWAVDVEGRTRGMQHPTGGDRLEVTAFGDRTLGGHAYADRRRADRALRVLEVASQAAPGQVYGPWCAGLGAAQVLTMKTMCAPVEAGNMSPTFALRAGQQQVYPDYCASQRRSREAVREQARCNPMLRCLPGVQAPDAPFSVAQRCISARRA